MCRFVLTLSPVGKSFERFDPHYMRATPYIFVDSPVFFWSMRRSSSDAICLTGSFEMAVVLSRSVQRILPCRECCRVGEGGLRVGL